MAHADQAERSYTLADNADWSPHPHTLRIYGRGASSIGEGSPKHYTDRDLAERHGRTWIALGIQPADCG